MADGSSKSISQVKVGDKVADAVPGDRRGEVHRGERVIVTKTDRDFVGLTIATHDAHGGVSGVGKLTTTAYHPFYDITQAAFVDAADLRPGERLQEPGGRTVEVLDVRHYTTTAITYDLTINGLHTYYVETGDAAVLVHNCDERLAYESQNAAENLQTVRSSATNETGDQGYWGTAAVIGVRNTRTGKVSIRTGVN